MVWQRMIQIALMALLLSVSPSAFSQSSSDVYVTFNLPDSYGRWVSSRDYAGVPIFLKFGASWCGGCQQGARRFGELAQELKPSGIQFIRVISGDHERGALDFQKHYRLPLVHLMDTDRSFERLFNQRGWPFLMLVGPDGKLKYKVNGLLERERQLLALLKQTEAMRSEFATQERDGVNYMTRTLVRSGEREGYRRDDTLSHLAAGPDGRVYLVFTARRQGNSDILMRIWDGQSWSADSPVAATEADEYDATVATDSKGQVWVGWTSNGFDNKYNIYVADLQTIQSGADPLQVTEAYDDAMHGRLAVDSNDELWITYYQWQKNRSGISRDREVFVRRWNGQALSRAIQISPTDVPSYEDHTDPTIVPMGSDMLVCWSWDYHMPKGYTRKAYNPTIFGRSISKNLRLDKPFHLSLKQIDMMPVLNSDGQDGVWCAWDSLTSRRTFTKQLFVRSVSSIMTSTRPLKIAENLKHLCSPSFAFSDRGNGVLVWCQTRNGRDWTLEMSTLDPDTKRWSAPRTLINQRNPRYSDAVFDTNGQLWVSYSQESLEGRRILAGRVEE